MNKANNDFWQIIVVWIVIIILSIFIGLYLVVKKPERDRLKKQKEIQRQEWVKSLSKDMQRHGIKTIIIFMDTDNYYDILERGLVWQKVKKAYVNEKPVDLDTLYKKEHFVYKHCDNKYYKIVAAGIDMVRYEFGKEIIETTRLFGVETKGRFKYSPKKIYVRYSKYLPRCWD